MLAMGVVQRTVEMVDGVTGAFVAKRGPRQDETRP